MSTSTNPAKPQPVKAVAPVVAPAAVAPVVAPAAVAPIVAPAVVAPVVAPVVVAPAVAPVVVAPAVSKGKKTKKAPQSMSSRLGLNMPVGRIHRYLRQQANGLKVRKDSSVYMAAVLEYLTAEVLVMANTEAKDAKKMRITERHLKLAIEKDADLRELFKDIIIPGGGVLPIVYPKKKRKRPANEDAQAK